VVLVVVVVGGSPLHSLPTVPDGHRGVRPDGAPGRKKEGGSRRGGHVLYVYECVYGVAAVAAAVVVKVNRRTWYWISAVCVGVTAGAWLPCANIMSGAEAGRSG
jgi:hypothetical protein